MILKVISLKVIRNRKSDDKVELRINKRNIGDITDLVSKQVSDYVAQWTSKFTTVSGSLDMIDNFIIDGGGVANVKDDFEKEFNQTGLIKLKIGQFANVSDFYKYGKAILK